MPEYGKLKVTELKEELGNRGLPKAGLKAELVKRLVEADSQSESPQRSTDDAGQRELAKEAENDVIATQDPASTEVSEPATNGAKTEDAKGHNVTDPVPVVTGGKIEAASADSKEKVIRDQVSSQESQHDASGTTQNPAEDDADDTIPQGHLTQPGTAQASEKTQLPIPSKTKSEIFQPPPDLHPVSTQGSLTTEEILEDSKKRKRRSQSPPPSFTAIKEKKLKADDPVRPHVDLPEDAGRADANTDRVDRDAAVNTLAVSEASHNVEYPEAEKLGSADRPALGTSSEPSQKMSHRPDPPSTDTRFKNLFSPSLASGKFHNLNAPIQTKEPENERAVAPSIHPATNVLYIRDLMRPLNPQTLKSHLTSLALPVAAEPSTESFTDEIITSFHLDTIRTHCLVSFSSTTAASRVRTALHDRIWPNERDRKPLWVDFVPEESLQKWIEKESQSAGGRGRGDTKKWEVIYEEEDGEIKAYLEEVGSSRGGLRTAQLAGKVTAPSGQGIRSAPSGPRAHIPAAPPPPRDDGAKGFQALDDLFKSTTAKPKLYFKPVAKDVVEKRLDLLDEGRGGGRSDEMRRFSFEDELIVDKGPEFGMRGRGGYRGGARAGGGYEGGGYRSRGGGYRSRGDGFRGGRVGGDRWQGSGY